MFNFLIQAAIRIRAAITTISNFIRRIGLPVIDAGLTLLSFWVIKNTWNILRPEIRYDNRLLWISFPIFTLGYLIIAYYAGLYDRRYRLPRLIRSALIATIVLLAGYALLPEDYRFSRAIILFGSLLAFVLIGFLRWVLVKTGVLESRREQEKSLNTIITGTLDEYGNTLRIMKEAGYDEMVIGRIAVTDNDKSALGNWKRMNQLYATVPYREIIYCTGAVSFKEIIENIQQLPQHIKVKFHADGSSSIVGSDSKNTSGEAFSKENGFKLSDPYNRRMKRLLDVFVSLTALISFPVHFLFIKKPLQFFTNCFAVLFAKKTWVGYASGEKPFPPLHKAVLACNGIPGSIKQDLPAESLQKINYWYAHEYEPANDLKLLWQNYKRLGG